ncbi:MAG: Wzz/FepE/Etk N-terminal domain-containing protein [Cypionkella sp.]
MGQIQSLEELISFLLRRRWLIILLTVFGTAAAVVYAKMQPSMYETAAVIQVEGARVVEGGNGPQQNDNGGAAQVLQTIEQRLTTREALQAVIERHNLFVDQPALPQDKRLFALRSNVTFQAVDSAAGQAFGESRRLSAIIVNARDSNPETAAALANDFAQGILDQSAAGQRERADQNVAFFRTEEKRIADALAKLEAESTAYKSEHADALPSLASTRRDELVSLTDDIRATSQQVAALKGEQAQIEARQTQRETDKRRLGDIAAQLDVLETQIAASNAHKAEVDKALADMAEVERVLAGYDRQLAQLQDQYAAATQRLTDATTAQRLAETQQSQRFTLLERAITPEFATGGGKKKIAIAGALGSLLLGLTLAFLLDLWKPVVRTSAQMQRQLDLEPVVCIPEIRQPKGRVGSAMLRVIDDPARPLLGLPRFVMLTLLAMVLLILSAALIS